MFWILHQVENANNTIWWYIYRCSHTCKILNESVRGFSVCSLAGPWCERWCIVIQGLVLEEHCIQRSKGGIRSWGWWRDHFQITAAQHNKGPFLWSQPTMLLFKTEGQRNGPPLPNHHINTTNNTATPVYKPSGIIFSTFQHEFKGKKICNWQIFKW